MTTLKRITISLDQLLSDQTLLSWTWKTTTNLETIAGNLAPSVETGHEQLATFWLL